MARKVRASGGRSPWLPVAAAESVSQVVANACAENGPWPLRLSRKSSDGWSIIEAGLLKTLACLSVDSIARRAACHVSTAARRVNRHQQLLIDDKEYRIRAGGLARAAIDDTFGR